jgi:hypothetical protein
MAELHCKGVSGWDTGASRTVTTSAQFMIPSLLDRSKSAIQLISFSSAQSMKKLRLASQQCYKNTDSDVVVRYVVERGK